MAIIDINWKPSPKELRQFAAVWFPLACAALGWVLFRITRVWYVPAVLAGLVVVLAPIAYFSLAFAERLYVVWMTLVFPIGWTVSHLLIGAIYYLLITPMGLIMRLCGRDAMGHTFDPAAESYWVARKPTADSKQYFRQY